MSEITPIPGATAMPVQATRPVAKFQSPYPSGQYCYIQTLRGPRRRWWKPVVAALSFIVAYVITSVILVVPLIIYLLTTKKVDLNSTDVKQVQSALMEAISNTADPTILFFLMISVVVMMPLAMLITWIVFRQKPATVWSVAGKIRWKWLFTCVIAMLILHGGTLVTISYLSGDITVNPRPDLWITLLVIVALVPVQTATEEYVFRGWFPQVLGSWFKNPTVAYIVTALAMVPVFAYMHGTFDPWLLVDLSLFAMFAVWLVWLTGGLEAAIALHFTNNFTLFIFDALSGGAHSSLATTATGSAGSTAFSGALYLVEMLVFYGLWKWTQKQGEIRRFAFRADNLEGIGDTDERGYDEQPRPAPTNW